MSGDVSWQLRIIQASRKQREEDSTWQSVLGKLIRYIFPISQYVAFQATSDNAVVFSFLHKNNIACKPSRLSYFVDFPS